MPSISFRTPQAHHAVMARMGAATSPPKGLFMSQYRSFAVAARRILLSVSDVAAARSAWMSSSAYLRECQHAFFMWSIHSLLGSKVRTKHRRHSHRSNDDDRQKHSIHATLDTDLDLTVGTEAAFQRRNGQPSHTHSRHAASTRASLKLDRRSVRRSDGG